MKIWFDILTPKQLLFYESMYRRLAKKHNVMCTSRNYREVTELARIRNFKMEMIGKHGGERLDSKLDAGIKRMQTLSAKIQRFKPDVTVSSCSPDASRISFGLGIPHIGFSNTPHGEAVMRLSVPLLSRFLTPSHIQKRQFTKYGIDHKRIIQYDAMDEFLIVNNRKVPSKLPDMKLNKNKTIVFRTYEAQASYVNSHTDVYSIIDAVLGGFPDCNIIVIGRYTSEIKQLKRRYRGQNIIILDKVVDSKAILSVADLFIGSGGTMADTVKADKDETAEKDDLKSEVKKWLEDNQGNDKREKVDELKGKYADLLRGSIEEIRLETNTRTLTEDEIQGAMHYIVVETIKDEDHKERQNHKNSEALNQDELSAFGIQFADASCPSTTDPTYKQVSIDISGGSYGGNTFAGDNDLYIVTTSDNSSTCERTYTLYFYDEDHPTLDALYDGLRQAWYNRIHDIESFTIKNNSTIEFDNTWSNDHDFNDTCWAIAGCHYTTTNTWSGGNVYVSNTWNHMMGTSDTNPSLSKVTVP